MRRSGERFSDVIAKTVRSQRGIGAVGGAERRPLDATARHLMLGGRRRKVHASPNYPTMPPEVRRPERGAEGSLPIAPRDKRSRRGNPFKPLLRSRDIMNGSAQEVDRERVSV